MKPFLCLIGLHKWKCLAKEYLKRWNPKHDGEHCIRRECVRCGKKQRLSGIMTQEGDVILRGYEDEEVNLRDLMYN